MEDASVPSNDTVRPSLWQSFLASRWLLAVWQTSFVVLAVAYVLTESKPTLSALANPWFLLFETFAILVAAAVGWVASIPAATIVLGPIVRWQGARNGGPFLPGDWVQVIAGPHRGTVTRVYSTWQHETARIDLGQEAERDFGDIFAAHQLLRADPPKRG